MLVDAKKREEESTGPCRNRNVRVPAKFGGLSWVAWVGSKTCISAFLAQRVWGRCMLYLLSPHDFVSWSDGDEVSQVASSWWTLKPHHWNQQSVPTWPLKAWWFKSWTRAPLVRLCGLSLAAHLDKLKYMLPRNDGRDFCKHFFDELSGMPRPKCCRFTVCRQPLARISVVVTRE